MKSDLRRIKQEITFHNEEDKFVDTVYGIIDAVEAKADKIKKRQSCNEREHFLSAFFPEILYRDCISLDEAIQKILFYNALFWQARHWHNGSRTFRFNIESVLYKRCGVRYRNL